MTLRVTIFCVLATGVPRLPRAGLHRPLGEAALLGPRAGDFPGERGGESGKGRGGNNGPTAAGKRGPNDTVTNVSRRPFTVRLSAGDAGRGIGKASGAPPARARASWVAYSLPGALPLR